MYDLTKWKDRRTPEKEHDYLVGSTYIAYGYIGKTIQDFYEWFYNNNEELMSLGRS